MTDLAMAVELAEEVLHLRERTRALEAEVLRLRRKRARLRRPAWIRLWSETWWPPDLSQDAGR